MIITKEREDKTRRANRNGDSNNANNASQNDKSATGLGAEFPKLILQEESVTHSEAAKDQVKTLSTREIIMFLLFCACFIVVVYLQLNVSQCYQTNSAIRNSLLQPSQTILNYTTNFVDFEQINVETSYWDWLKQLIYALYIDEYYDGYPIPTHKRFAIPNFNRLVSPVRITQRRIKLVPNEDPYTRRYVQDGWASFGFDYLSSFDADYEEKASFGSRNLSSFQMKTLEGALDYRYPLYNYSKTNSFYGKGGFVVTMDINNFGRNESLKMTEALRATGFLDRQTRSVVVDMVLFNAYTDFFTMVTFVAIFEANGLLTTQVNLYNLKRFYYRGVYGAFRLLCEIAFVLLLIFYILIEVNEVRGQIKLQRREFEKEHKKKQPVKKFSGKNILQNDEEEQEGMPSKHQQKVERIKGEENEDNQEQEQHRGSSVIHYCSFVIKGMKEHYSNDGWNFINAAFLTLSGIAVCIWASIIYQHLTEISPLELEDLHHAEKNEVFFKIAFRIEAYLHICSIIFVLLFVKLLKYLASWFERAMIIFKTLERAQSDIFYFLIMYLVIFLAFVVMCHIYYGSELTSFGSVPEAMRTLFLMLMGDLDFLDDMIVLNKTLSFFFFIFFITSMQFILMNMFIAFISKSYSEVSAQLSVDCSVQDDLKAKHWLVRLQELKQSICRRCCSCKKKKKLAYNSKQKQSKKEARISRYVEEDDNKKKTGAAEAVIQTALRKSRIGEALIQLKLNKEQPAINNDSSPDNSNGTGLRREKNLFAVNKPDQGEEIISKPFNDVVMKGIITKAGTSSINSEEQQPAAVINGSEEKSEDIEEMESSVEEKEDKNQAKAEMEKASSILLRKEWDKTFDEKQFMFEEPSWTPSLISERQEQENIRDKEQKCGRILWSSIAFTIYTALYVSVILIQLSVDRNYTYNSALKSHILSLGKFYEESDMRLENIQNYREVVYWLENWLPQIGEAKLLPRDPEVDNSEEGEQIGNLTGFYIREVNYVTNEQFRLCFRLAKKATVDQNSTEAEEYQKGSSEYYTEDFIGKVSGQKYIYHKGSDGFQRDGSYCQLIKFLPFSSFNKSMSSLVSDDIISDQMEMLSVEFTTVEASQDVHSYISIYFTFPLDGSVQHTIDVFTLRLNMYRRASDFIRMAFEILYVVLLAYNMLLFIRQLRRRNEQYKRWQVLEVDSLSEVERLQRHRKRPEWLRKWDAVIQSYTYFDIIYFTLAVSSIAMWVFYCQQAAALSKPLQPYTVALELRRAEKDPLLMKQLEGKLDYYSWYYFVLSLLSNLTNLVAFNTIFLSVKVFDYFNKSRQMSLLSNTLYRAREDTIYFIVIFVVLMFGFVGMAYVSFGTQLSGYHTVGDAVRMCFQITIGEFTYDELAKTNPTMAILFFFPFNVLFVFVLTNIFLAIINQTYHEASSHAKEEPEDERISLLNSFLFCFKRGSNSNGNNGGGMKKVPQGIEKKSGGGQDDDYLEVFDKLALNLQSNCNADIIQQDNANQSSTATFGGTDLKTWAINCADEIKTELKVRSHLRNQSREALLAKLRRTKKSDNDLPNSDKSAAQLANQMTIVDDLELIKRRLQYWDFLRTGTQFISLQNRVLATVVKEKEQDIQKKAAEYASEKEKTREMYKYVALLEKPVEEKLEKVLHFRKVLSLLDQEREILTSQLAAVSGARERAEGSSIHQQQPQNSARGAMRSQQSARSGGEADNNGGVINNGSRI